MKQSATILLLGLVSGAGLWAQGTVGFSYQAGPRLELQDNKAVKGAPYSATAISTSTQILGDGTRITRNNQIQLVRDSDGRTRREEGINAVGPWTAGSEQRIVTISDPVAQVRYSLFPDTQTAVRINVLQSEMQGEVMAKLKRSIEEISRARPEDVRAKEDLIKEARAKESAERGPVTFSVSGTAGTGGQAMTGWAAGERVMTYTTGDSGNFNVILNRTEKSKVKNEDLGEKVIEGVSAKGRRESHTIAVGEIGNDRPIEVTSESWYSDELKTVVYSKRSDPRVGETEYKMTNISRAEPARTLFEVPAGYTMKEEGRRHD
jgi:hypothetical protein